MTFILGGTIVQPWTVLDTNSDPLTGVTTPAGITFTLHRQSGSLMIAATETITWAEDVGSAGHYSIRFTPLNLGVYYLQLKELHASSLLRTFAFAPYSIVTAGSVFLPSFVNAFCGLSDIERWIQHDISATTAPSETEAAAFAETRASVLMSLMAKWGLTVTPTTLTTGSRLEDMLREANAIGAALDYTVAMERGVSPSKSDRANDLAVLWSDYTGTPKPGHVTATIGYLQHEIQGSLVSLSTDHILSGDTLAAPSSGTPPTNTPIGFGMGDLF